MFQKICDEDDIWEGGTVMGAANGHRVLIVWPEGGKPGAVQGICPHLGVPLDSASLKGTELTCTQHHWTFDCVSGDSIDPPGCAMALYPMKIEDGVVWVDTDGVTPLTEGF